jgi:uncharacterized protein (DUF1501 family)
MSTTRREFLQNGLAFVSLGLAMPTFLMRAAQADPSGLAQPGDPALPAIPPGKILVVVEMSGGNDGLNTVIPYTDPGYAKMRPTIGIPSRDVVPITANIGLHPNMKSLKKLYEGGHLAVLPGVGYPNPNRSHFHSMDIWQTADPEVDIRERTGWIARYFDSDGHFKGNPLSGITLGSSLPLTLFSQDAPAAAIGNGQNYGFVNRDGNQQKRMDALKALYSTGTVAGGVAEFVRNVGSEAYSSSLELKQAFKDYDTKAGNASAYPQNNGFASGLQTISKLITGGLGTRVYYLSMGGFDTHANQPRQHADLLGSLADGLAAFYQDLALQGRDKDVTVMTFSEFGRRTKENGSAGTDHGAASSLLVLGGGIKGGICGDYPSLSDLDDGDLRFHTDFRSVYATLIDKWLGSNSQPVLGGQFKHLDFV